MFREKVAKGEEEVGRHLARLRVAIRKPGLILDGQIRVLNKVDGNSDEIDWTIVDVHWQPCAKVDVLCEEQKADVAPQVGVDQPDIEAIEKSGCRLSVQIRIHAIVDGLSTVRRLVRVGMAALVSRTLWLTR